MRKFTCDFSVPAGTPMEAEKKLSALSVLASYLTEAELTKLAHVVKNDPINTALAKSFLKM